MAGSREQSGGITNVAAARVIGNSMLRERLWREFELREITESRSHSIGSPKMVLTVTSEPKPKETVIGEPDTSVYQYTECDIGPQQSKFHDRQQQNRRGREYRRQA